MAAKKKPKVPTVPRGSRARAREPVGRTPEKPERVQHIVDLMTSMQFVCGRTTRELSRKWQMSERTVEDDAAEASRYIRSAVDRDPDEMRAQLVSQLQFLTRSAMRRKQERTAIEGVKAMAGLLGLEAPKKLDVGGTLADLIPLAFDDERSAAPTREPGHGGSDDSSADRA